MLGISFSVLPAIYEGLGDYDTVFEWREIAIEECDMNNFVVKVEPSFDDEHSDPRWTKLMGKMSLAD